MLHCTLARLLTTRVTAGGAQNNVRQIEVGVFVALQVRLSGQTHPWSDVARLPWLAVPAFRPGLVVVTHTSVSSLLHLELALRVIPCG